MALAGPRPVRRRGALSPSSFDDELRRSCGVAELVGIDEAGRGPLAGPVVAAAVRLGPGDFAGLSLVRDSKLLSPARREALLGPILAAARAVSLAWAHPREIERDNILAATLSAMRRAARRSWLQAASAGSGAGQPVRPGPPAQAQPAAPPLVLIDGPHLIPGLELPQRAVVDGDRLSLAIACASVVAKVLRDRWMERLDRLHPGYGFARHKGYGTALHLEALGRLGPSPLHRRTYAPVREILAGNFPSGWLVSIGRDMTARPGNFPREAGALAEGRAADFLRERGFLILERNFRSRWGEIDIVAREGETLVFVEVRSRAGSGFGTSAESVGPGKRRRLLKTAGVYLSRGRLGEMPARFDVVAIDGDRLEHIPGAF